MIRKTGMALLLGVAMIAGCEKKEEKPADAVKSVTDAAKDAAKTTTDAAKDAAKTTSDAAKATADKAKDAAASAKDAAIAEVQKLIDPLKKDAEALYTKAASKLELKPLVESLKGEIGGLDKLVADAKTSDKWSSLLADAKGKIDSAKKLVADLTAKLK